MPFVTLNELTPRPVEWLCPGRLPLGHLVMFDGDPGLGKSLVTLDLCARLTTGRPFPDGSPAAAPSRVIVVSGEDGNRDTIYARLAEAGADLARVVVWERAPGEPWLRLPSQLDRLEEIIARTGACYVVLDPLLAFLDASVNVGFDPSVRQALAPLADVAARHRCVIEMVRHLNKGGGSRALYRGLYSIAFTAVCRVTWLVGRDPKTPKQYVLAQVKNNLDPPPPSLAYAITPGASGAARIDWRGTSWWTEDELLAFSNRQRGRQRACAFLADFLKNGPRTSREIWEEAQKHCLSRRTLQRAQRELKIRCRRTAPFTPQQATYWVLPGHDLPESLGDANAVAVDEWLRQLAEQYPASSPLDEES